MNKKMVLAFILVFTMLGLTNYNAQVEVAEKVKVNDDVEASDVIENDTEVVMDTAEKIVDVNTYVEPEFKEAKQQDGWVIEWPTPTYSIETKYENGIVVQKIERRFSPNTDKEIDYLNELFNKDGKRTYYNHVISSPEGVKEYSNKTTYTDAGLKTATYKKWYYANEKPSEIKEYLYDTKYDFKHDVDFLNETFNTHGDRTYYRHIIHDPRDEIKTYDNMTEYTASGVKTDVIRKWYDGSNGQYYMTGKKVLEYDRYTKNEIDYVNEQFNSAGRRTYYRHIVRDDLGRIEYSNKTTYDSSGNRLRIEKLWYNNRGEVIDSEIIE